MNVMRVARYLNHFSPPYILQRASHTAAFNKPCDGVTVPDD